LFVSLCYIIVYYYDVQFVKLLVLQVYKYYMVHT